MADDIAISVKNLTKTYRIFGHHGDRIKQALTFGRMRFHSEFTALQDVSFEIKKGEADAIIAAVSHKKYLAMPLTGLLAKLKSGGVFVDVKSTYDPVAIETIGYRLWRL